VSLTNDPIMHGAIQAVGASAPPAHLLELIERLLDFWQSTHEVTEIHAPSPLWENIYRQMRENWGINLNTLSDTIAFHDIPIKICGKDHTTCIHVVLGRELPTASFYDPNVVWSEAEFMGLPIETKLTNAETLPEGLMWE
jgi:hypothetical protein